MLQGQKKMMKMAEKGMKRTRERAIDGKEHTAMQSFFFIALFTFQVTRFQRTKWCPEYLEGPPDESNDHLS